MKPVWSAGIPSIVQATLVLGDEIIFHRKRGLPRWERIGHPLDTVSVLLPIALASFYPPSRAALKLYAGLATLSTLFVTKDEAVHLRECGAWEHRLHALMYSVHPLVFLGWTELWKASKKRPALKRLLKTELAAIAGFLAYQMIKPAPGGWSGPSGKGERGKGGGPSLQGEISSRFRRPQWGEPRLLRRSGSSRR